MGQQLELFSPQVKKSGRPRLWQDIQSSAEFQRKPTIADARGLSARNLIETVQRPDGLEVSIYQVTTKAESFQNRKGFVAVHETYVVERPPSGPARMTRVEEVIDSVVFFYRGNNTWFLGKPKAERAQMRVLNHPIWNELAATYRSRLNDRFRLERYELARDHGFQFNASESLPQIIFEK